MSTNLLEAFGIDPELEEQGVWVEIVKDVKVKVCAIGTQNHMKILEKLKAPHQAQIRANTLDPEIEEAIHVKAMAKTVLVDWEGMTDPDTNKPLPYSYENAVKLLSDPRLKRFKGTIFSIATQQETFRKQEVEESTKNLKKSSGGSSSGQNTKES